MEAPDRGGIVGMASLQEFLEILGDAYPDEKVRGKEFEPVGCPDLRRRLARSEGLEPPTF